MFGNYVTDSRWTAQLLIDVLRFFSNLFLCSGPDVRVSHTLEEPDSLCNWNRIICVQRYFETVKGNQLLRLNK